MNVSVGREFEEFVQKKVASGDYASVSEVVRDGLRLLVEPTYSVTPPDDKSCDTFPVFTISPSRNNTLSIARLRALFKSLRLHAAINRSISA